jgi:hypothetical protein
VRAGRAVLDGGWWPRSWDAVAELPGLVLALSARYGRIRQLMLNNVVWTGHFKRLPVGDGVVRAGWFANIDPAMLIATTYDGDQIDLLVVPPTTADGRAGSAMARAADPANSMRAHAILTAVSASENPVQTVPRTAGDHDEHPVWDNDGGAAPAGRRPL